MFVALIAVLQVTAAQPSQISLLGDAPLLAQATLTPTGTSREALTRRITDVETQLATLKPAWPAVSIVMLVGGVGTAVAALLLSTLTFGAVATVFTILHFVGVIVGIVGLSSGLTVAGRIATRKEQLETERDVLRQALRKMDSRPASPPSRYDPTVPWMVEREAAPRVVLAAF